jgi:hypothetical protein
MAWVTLATVARLEYLNDKLEQYQIHGTPPDLYDTLSTQPNFQHYREQMAKQRPDAILLHLDNLDKAYGVWAILDTGEKILTAGYDEDGTLTLVRDYL